MTLNTKNCLNRLCSLSKVLYSSPTLTLFKQLKNITPNELCNFPFHNITILIQNTKALRVSLCPNLDVQTDPKRTHRQEEPLRCTRLEQLLPLSCILTWKGDGIQRVVELGLEGCWPGVKLNRKDNRRAEQYLKMI